jgi:spore maturation protein CgeB
MRILYFTHSLTSCWNHGNAHFQRGLVRELTRRGHRVTAFEPARGWSRNNLVADHGEAPLSRFRARFADLDARAYPDGPDVPALLEGADLVIVHEWSEPELVAAIGAERKRGASFILLFHDTHHRAVSDPAAMRGYDLSGYDGVLAFGESLASVYRRWGWGRRVFVMHEAADTSIFEPRSPGDDTGRDGVVWIGNWGDDERTAELRSYLLSPARDLGLALDVYGVRYPPGALAALIAHGARYRGWVANCDVPEILARHRMTVHVPRRLYSAHLPGIPTIRVFEALACGIPLVCAPWEDIEGLFRPGEDYLAAASGEEMRKHMRALQSDAALRKTLVSNGLDRIRSKHTCAHRADQLLAIAASMKPRLEGAA